MVPCVRSLRKHNRKINRIGSHNSTEYIAYAITILSCQRTMHIIQLYIQVKRNGRRLREMKIHVVLERIFHVVYIIFIREEVTGTIFQHSGFMIHIDIHKISNFRCTSTYIKIRFLIKCRIFEDLLVPVHIRINIRIQIMNRTIYFFIRIEHSPCSLIGNRFIVQTHISGSVNNFRFLSRSIYIAF